MWNLHSQPNFKWWEVRIPAAQRQALFAMLGLFAI
jgi:hypothetical protein